MFYDYFVSNLVYRIRIELGMVKLYSRMVAMKSSLELNIIYSFWFLWVCINACDWLTDAESVEKPVFKLFLIPFYSRSLSWFLSSITTQPPSNTPLSSSAFVHWSLLVLSCLPYTWVFLKATTTKATKSQSTIVAMRTTQYADDASFDL